MTRVSSRQVHDIGRRRAWVIWAGRALGLRAGGLQPQLARASPGCWRRTGSTSAPPSWRSFTVLQLLVYAGMQVPVGVRLDRYGSEAAAAGRAGPDDGRPAGVRVRRRRSRSRCCRAGVLGAGDAMIFTSRAPAGDGVVPGPAGADGHPAHRPGRPARRDRWRRRRWRTPCRSWGWTPAFAARLVDRPGADGRGRAAGQGLAVPSRGRHQDQAARPGPHPARRVGQPRDPARAVVALRLAVLGDRLLDAVGLPVPGPRAGPEPGARPARC